MAKKKHTIRKLHQIRRRRIKNLQKVDSLNFFKAKQQGNILQNTKDRVRPSDGTSVKQFGFTRFSVRQDGAIKNGFKRKKNHLLYRATCVPDVVRAPISHRYMSIDYIDYLYELKRIPEIISYLYNSYKDFERMYIDYQYGFRDKLFVKIAKKTGIFNNDKYLQIFRDNYEDILSEGITRFLEVKHERITLQKYEAGTYYRIIYAILPTAIYHYFSSLVNYEINKDDYVEDEDCGYVDQYFNLLEISNKDEFKKINANTNRYYKSV